MNNNKKDLRKHNVYEILGIHLNTYDVFDMDKKAADVRVAYKLDNKIKHTTLKDLDLDELRKLYLEKEKEVKYSPDLYDLVKNAYKELAAFYSNELAYKHFNENIIKLIRDELIIKIDSDADYYDVLGISKDSFESNKKNIFRTNGKKVEDVRYSNLSKNEKELAIDKIDMATFVLANEDIRRYYEDKAIIVKEAKEDKRVADEARRKANMLSKALPWIIIGGAVLFFGTCISSKLKQDKEIFKLREKEALEESTGAIVDQEELVPDTSLAFVDGDTLDVDADVTEETTENYELIGEEREIAAEELEPVIDINDEERINEITDDIYNDIQGLPKNIRKDLDKETIEALVRYARRYNPNYTGADLLNNEDAYEYFYGLAYSKQFNIAKFYEDLENYTNINNVSESLLNVKKDNSYEDEYSAYNAIGKAVNNMDKSDYSEVVALRALVDAYIDEETMIIARNGEGVEEITVDGSDVNYDKDIDGNVVDSEYKRAKIKYSSQDCIDVYNMVNLENRNAILTDLAYEALEDDKSRSR